MLIDLQWEPHISCYRWTVSAFHWILISWCTYLITYSIELSPSWDAKRFSASQEIPPILWNQKVYYRIHKCPPHVSEAFVSGSEHVHFEGEELLAPRPTPILKYHPLSAVRGCLFNTFAATLRSSIRNLRTRHAVVAGTHLSCFFFYRFIHKNVCIVNNCWVISASLSKTVIYCTIVSCMRTHNFSNLITNKLCPAQREYQSTEQTAWWDTALNICTCLNWMYPNVS